MPALSEIYSPPPQLPSSLWKLLEDGAKKGSTNPAVTVMHQPASHLSCLKPHPHRETSKPWLSWTYAELRYASLRLAAGMSAHGVERGSTIAMLTPNGIEVWLLLWVSAILQLTLVPLDPGLLTPGREGQLKDYLERTSPDTVVLPDAGSEEKLQAVLVSCSVEIKIFFLLEQGTSSSSKSLEEAAIDGARLYEHFPELAQDPKLDKNGDRTAVILFTSGTTTGHPKGCPLSLRGILNAAVNDNGMGPGLTSAQLITGIAFRVIWLGMSLACFKQGAHAIMPSATFSAPAILDAVEKFEDVCVLCIPVQIRLFKHDLTPGSRNLKSLRTVFMGGDIVTHDAVTMAKQCFPHSQVCLAHGMTEGYGLLGQPSGHQVVPAEAHYHNIMAIGVPLPGALVRICDDEGKVLPRGESGNLHFGGPGPISRYLGKEQPEAFYSDERGSWLLPGDRAVMDETGRVFIVGRTKDIIKRVGISLSPAVIESELNRCDGVEAVVIGVLSPEYGELPVAIVRDTPQSQDRDRIKRTVIEALGPDCALQDVKSLTELGMTEFPINQTGKVMKILLKEAYLKLVES